MFPLLIPGLFAVFFCAFSFALTCEPLNRHDPDEMFDAIGKTQFCSDYDKDPVDEVRNGAREDLGKGVLTSNAGNNSEGGRAVAMGPGGLTYVAGRTEGADNNFLILKYFPDGSLDTAFNTDGILLESFGNGDDIAHAIAIQQNGAVVVAGRSDKGSLGNFDFAVLRLLPSGNLDTTFSTDGKLTVNVGTSVDIARGVAIFTNGRMLLGGYSKVTNYDFSFIRFYTDGVLDTTFSSDGKAIYSNGPNEDGALSVTIDTVGRVLAGGNCDSDGAGNWDFASMRLKSDGTLDTTFNTTGKRTFSIGTGEEAAYGVATDTAHRVILGGASRNATRDVAIARLETDGSLDTTFNTNGKRTIDLNSNDDGLNGISVSTNGTLIYGAGYANNGTNNDFAVIKLIANGGFDTSFNTNGRILRAVLAAEDTAQSIHMKGDGVILVAGRTDTNGSGAFDIALMRIQTDGTMAQSGRSVMSFGTSGFIQVDFNGIDWGSNLLADTSGRLVASGYSSSNTNDFAVARILINGALDTSFHTDGKQETNLGGTDFSAGSALQTDGQIVLCGAGGAGGSFYVARYSTNGVLDTSFNTAGSKALSVAITVGTCGTVAQTTDGKLMVAGSTGADAYIARLLTNGDVDTSFRTVGGFTQNINGSDKINSSILDTDGKYVIFGNNGGASDNNLWGRYHTDGSLDTSFHTDGLYDYLNPGGHSNIGTTGNLLSRAPQGGYYTASTSEKSNLELFTYRYTTSGSFDTTFHTDGIAGPFGTNQTVSATLSAINGKLIGIVDDQTIIYPHRFLTSGEYDTTFGTNGFPAFNVTAGNDAVHGSTFTTDEGWICINSLANAANFGVLCVWQ